MGSPRHPGFRLIRLRLSWHGWYADQHIARRALDLPSRELLLALKVLVAVGTIEFELTHGFSAGL